MHGRLRFGACAAAVAAAALAVTAAAPPAGTAHAQDDDGAIPEWVRIVFGYYADGSISDAELLAALQYLADQGIIKIGTTSTAAAEPAAPAMSEEAEWAADEAKLEDAIAVRLRDDMQAFRVELRAGAYIPGEPADYDKAVEAGRAEIKAVEAYADTLRTAAADGRITAAEKKTIEDAGLAADDAAAASYEAFMATPMAPLLEFSGGMMDMFAGAMAGTGGASIDLSMPPPASQAPATNAPAPPRSVATAGEASDEADYLADLAKNQRKHLRNFELGLAGSDYRTTGDFGSAGSSAASAAGGNIAAYNPMIDAIREAIRASERLASVLEDAAEDGSISAAESDAIEGAYAAADEAGTAAAAAYDATPYAQHSPYGMFASFMDGFR